MANPQDLAEQAFALLQDALRESEARAADLDEQLKRRKAPKNKLEEQLDVLTHRLESVEAERTRWQQEAGHLEEMVEAERAKVAALKKKLQVAESGPDKLTKKEINFWRAKADDIDTETRDYKNRIAALRKELLERDALIERLQSGAAQAPAAPASNATPPAAAQPVSAERSASEPIPQSEGEDLGALQAQLAEREARLEALTAELAELREHDSRRAAELAELRERENRLTAEITELRERESRHAAELQELRERERLHAEDRAAAVVQNGELDGLRRQIATLESALTETHTARADAAAELARTRAELAEQQRHLREVQASTERMQETLAERDHRLVEISAELEHLRADVAQNQQRERELRESADQLNDRISELTEALEAAERAEREQRNQAAEALAERDDLRNRWQAAQTTANRLAGELDDARSTLAARADELERDARAATERLQEALAARERELAERDRQIADHDRSAAEQADRIASLEREIDELGRRIEAQNEQIEGHNRTLAERQELLVERNERLSALSEQLAARGREIAERDQRIAALSSEVEHARAVLHDHEQELANTRDALLATNRDLEQSRQHKQRLEAELSDVMTRLDQSNAEAREMREQIAGLESELKEEKEAVENLSEIANERREHITKLTEQVEEANERYEEAKWRLGKAAHFERLVKRRKKLVKSLLAALRAKMKANVALKAGLDGLRVYKAAAEANQQKLLARIDSLKAELEEAEEAIARHQGSTLAKEQLATSQTRIQELEGRLNTQAELIQSLEADLKTAKVTQKSYEEKAADHARLEQELAAKDAELKSKLELIVQLQSDLDEQQRRLAKLRGSESETMRLKAINEKDRSAIDALEREIAQLREALQRQQKNGAAANGGDLDAKLKERESAVAKLMVTVKDHEATIKKLNESVESWKRKYNFLATDAPEAYKTGSEK